MQNLLHGCQSLFRHIFAQFLSPTNKCPYYNRLHFCDGDLFSYWKMFPSLLLKSFTYRVTLTWWSCIIPVNLFMHDCIFESNMNTWAHLNQLGTLWNNIAYKKNYFKATLASSYVTLMTLSNVFTFYSSQFKWNQFWSNILITNLVNGSQSNIVCMSNVFCQMYLLFWQYKLLFTFTFQIFTFNHQFQLLLIVVGIWFLCIHIW